MDDHADHCINADDPGPMKILLNGGIESDVNCFNEVGPAIEILTKVDLDLAYCSEKLVNLEILLMHILAFGLDFEEMTSENDSVAAESMERALTFDLLYSYLYSEVRELDNLIDNLHGQIVDTRNYITSCADSRESVELVLSKLHDSEELLQQSEDHVLEMKMQLAKLQMASLGYNQNDWKCNRGLGPDGNFQDSKIEMSVQMQTERKHILRMLEKSLARELDLEKKLTELTQNKEDLIVKLCLTEKVASYMEEAAEVVWGRFLEAENASEVLMGISKDMVGRLQIVHFNLSGSIQREDDMLSKLQYCSEQLKVKETKIDKLNGKIVQLTADNSEVSALKEKVKLLEEQLRECQFHLNKANESNEASQEQLREMDGIVESMKESIFEAESRADSAESKVSQLTETNLELTEELGFVRVNNDSDAKKVTLLEKQLRESELQLQHARASSEAGQEQQNMLYSAIWDMETLIDELKQKVAKAESMTENAEQRCLILSETNLDLNKELDFLKVRMECLEASLHQGNNEKVESAKNINIKTNLIMDMVMQLTTERKRLEKKTYTLKEENRVLRMSLEKTKKDASGNWQYNGVEQKELPYSVLNSMAAVSTEISEEVVIEPSAKIPQDLGLSDDDAPAGKTEVSSSISADNDPNLPIETQSESLLRETEQAKDIYIFVAILVFLLSMLATYMLNKCS